LIVWEILHGNKQWHTGEEFVQMLKEDMTGSLRTKLNLKKSIYQELRTLALKCLSHKAEMRPSFVDVIKELLRISSQHADNLLQGLWEELQSLQGCKEDGYNNQGVAFLGYHNHEMAIKSWKQALNLDSNHLWTIYNYYMLRIMLNTSNEIDLIRHLHSCQESAQRDYFLFLTYLRSGKLAYLEHEKYWNLELLPELSMKHKIRAINELVTSSDEHLQENFEFIQVFK